MNKDFKSKVLIVLISAFMGSLFTLGASFILATYQQEVEKEKNTFALNKELYDKHHKNITIVKKAYQNLFSRYGESFGITTFEIEKEYEAFKAAKSSYSTFVNELERYGNDEQLHAVNLMQNILHQAFFEFYVMHGNAKRIQKEFEIILPIKDRKSDRFKLHDDIINTELDRLIKNENRAFYTLQLHTWPLILDIEQYINFSFRKALELEQTASIIESVSRIDDGIKNRNDFVYKEKDQPYLIAKMRSRSSPDIIIQGDTTDIVNAGERINTLNKFALLTINNSEYLQHVLPHLEKQHAAPSTSIP